MKYDGLYDGLRHNIPIVLRWAAQDMSANGRQWIWRECPVPGAYWAVRNGFIDHPEEKDKTRKWDVCTVGLLLPRFDLWLARLALIEVARRIDQCGICSDQAGGLYYNARDWGHLATHIYCDKVGIGFDSCWIYAVIAGGHVIPREGGEA